LYLQNQGTINYIVRQTSTTDGAEDAQPLMLSLYKLTGTDTQAGRRAQVSIRMDAHQKKLFLGAKAPLEIASVSQSVSKSPKRLEKISLAPMGVLAPRLRTLDGPLVPPSTNFIFSQNFYYFFLGAHAKI
jgi:hypothetical protein